MGLLDIPRGLISHLPLIGGSGDDSKSDQDEEVAEDEPTAEAPDETEVEEPDTSEADEPDSEEDEPDSEEDEPDSEEDQPDSDPDGSGREAEGPDSDPDGSGREAEQPSGGTSEDISDTTAPSIGPNTVIEKDSPEERLARHEQSDKDAMGLDKRREVIGGSYSAGFGKQLLRWVVVVIVIGAAAFGAKLLVDDLDKAPAQAADKAPWTDTDKTPKPLDEF